MDMKREVIICSCIITIFIVLSFISAQELDSVESEIKKLTHYAEEYETGNIDYVQLVLYSGVVREHLQTIAGVIDTREGGILAEEQVRHILGTPTEETKWVWVEKEEQERKIDKAAPRWEKIIFDGKKIQIKLNAHPTFYTPREEHAEERIESKEKLIYRFHFSIDFKKPTEQLDIQSKIGEIQTLAKKFDESPTEEQREILARESVNVEKAFESYFRQSSLVCEDTMNELFGTENQRGKQMILVKEFIFFEGDDFEVKAHLEMCDACERNWINLNLWTERRSFVAEEEPQPFQQTNVHSYKGRTSEDLKQEMKTTIDQLKMYYAQGNFDHAKKEIATLRSIEEAWNDETNNVWEEVNQQYAHIQQGEQTDRYYWIKVEQEKRQKVKELRQKNYETRKQFYNELFSGYESKEFLFEQQEWEKRLLEKLREHGEEICDDGTDNNNNGEIDCEEAQCGGKTAGLDKKIVGEGKEAHEEIIQLYCINGERKEKEEVMTETISACGNHICETHEYRDKSSIPTGLSEEELTLWQATHVMCPLDCSVCPTYEPIACEGTVIFKGEDMNGCQLEPICILTTPCQTDEDCTFRCGIGMCSEGICQLKELNDCAEVTCIDGEKQMLSCTNGETIVSMLCQDGSWISTELTCEESTSQEEISRGESVGEHEDSVSCITQSNCGNEHDVCSNGMCVTIPQTIEQASTTGKYTESLLKEIEEKTVSEGEEQKEIETTQEGTPQKIINDVVQAFRTLVVRVIQPSLTGYATNEEGAQAPQVVANEIFPESSGEKTPEEPQLNEEEARLSRGEQDHQEQESRRQREQEERTRQCNEQCDNNCEEIIVRCVEACVFIEGSEKTNDLAQCKTQCDGEKKNDYDQCTKACNENCLKGESFRPEVERQKPKEELSVFKAGGQCRTNQDKKEGFIHFDGWGEQFSDFHLLKNKYYQGGNSEWCAQDIQNLVRQREEFEKGFNEAFARWFFDQYLANSAEDWQEHVSGIYELYWRNVDTQRQLAGRMRCLGKKDITDVYQPQLINFKYESVYGSIEYWEELHRVKMEGIDEEVEVISPYMKLWVFPNKEFIVSEMKHAMEKHIFPGSEGETQTSEGPSDEEKRMLRADEAFMEEIRDIATRYDDGLSGVVQLKNFETNDIVFNVLVNINEEDILTVAPLLPSENPSSDVTIELDFDKMYEFIEMGEKEMRSARVERPPWDNQVPIGETINEFIGGVQMYFKIRSLINNARVTPEEAEKDIKKITRRLLWKIISKGEGEKQLPEQEEMKEDEKNPFATKESITGEAVK